MNRFISVVLLIINAISFVVMVVFVAYGLFEQIVGRGYVERLLKKFNIPLSYSQIFLIGIVSIVLVIITYILRMKLSGKPL